VLPRTLVYFNCEVAPLLKAAGEVNPTVNLLVGLLNPPSRATCQSAGVPTTAAASERARLRLPASGHGGVFSGLSDRVFGQRLQAGLAAREVHTAAGAATPAPHAKQANAHGGGR
jgi:hypothetical protein